MAVPLRFLALQQLERSVRGLVMRSAKEKNGMSMKPSRFQLLSACKAPCELRVNAPLLDGKTPPIDGQHVSGDAVVYVVSSA